MKNIIYIYIYIYIYIDFSSARHTAPAMRDALYHTDNYHVIHRLLTITIPTIIAIEIGNYVI